MYIYIYIPMYVCMYMYIYIYIYIYIPKAGVGLLAGSYPETAVGLLRNYHALGHGIRTALDLIF